jgi:hypothetical protein
MAIDLADTYVRSLCLGQLSDPDLLDSSTVTMIQAWILLLHKRFVMQVAYPRVTYGPALVQDQERIANVNFIYNMNDL